MYTVMMHESEAEKNLNYIWDYFDMNRIFFCQNIIGLPEEGCD